MSLDDEFAKFTQELASLDEGDKNAQATKPAKPSGPSVIKAAPTVTVAAAPRVAKAPAAPPAAPAAALSAASSSYTPPTPMPSSWSQVPPPSAAVYSTPAPSSTPHPWLAYAQSSTPSAAPMGSAGAASASSSKSKPAKTKGKTAPLQTVRHGGGETWEDPSMTEWDPNDYRIFVGDIDPCIAEPALIRAFQQYPSFKKAKLIPHRVNKVKNRGFGFVSFSDIKDYVRAMREMNGKYIGNRPISLRKSDWKDRQLTEAKKNGTYRKPKK